MLQEIKDWWKERQENKQLEKTELNSLRQEAMAEAKLEVRDEAKELLKAKYKQEALDKLQGKNDNKLAKTFAKGLENLGKGTVAHFKGMDMEKKLQGMVGPGRNHQQMQPQYQQQYEEEEPRPRRRKVKKKAPVRKRKVITNSADSRPKLKVYNKFPKRDIREFI